MTPDQKPEVQTKTNHSSMWLKISWPFGWAKIKITRRSESFEANTQKALDEIEALWISTENKGMTYGDRFAAIEKKVKA